MSGFSKKRNWLLSGSISLLLLLVALNSSFPLNIPTGTDSFSTVVLAKDGQTLRAFADRNGIWRQQVALKDVSPLYIEALLSYEDQYFWYHPGINPVSLVRAAWQNWRHGKIISGGSTLSMQVARILHPHRRTLKGKLYQMLRTVQLELLLSKEEILTLYLNFAPFGGTIEGVEAASYAYLDKASSRLTHAEAALLAVLPQRPSMNRPDRYPQRAKAVRDKVLDRLQQLAIWTTDTVAAARLESVIADSPQKPGFAPLFSRYLKAAHPKQTRIQSTLDYHVQTGLESLLKNHIDRSPNGSSGAILVVDNSNNEVIAWLGSADFANQSRFGHVDMVAAIRSPGSTLKPFIYGLAIDTGLIHSHSLLSDAPRITSAYQPRNFNGYFSGPVTVQRALQRSLNVPAVQVLEQLGPSELHNRLASAGVKLSLPENAVPNLSLALGGAGINLWQLVTLYSSFAHNGNAIEPVLTPDTQASGRYLMSPQAAWITHKMLSDNPRPDTIHNPAVLKRRQNMAWKTGTSYGFRDAWAIGVSQRYTIGIWLGRPDGTPQPGHYGALNAAPLLFSVSDRLHQGITPGIKMPEGVQKIEICWPLGTPKQDQEPQFCHASHAAWLVDGLIPPTFSNAQHDNWQRNPITFWLDVSNNKQLGLGCELDAKVKTRVAVWPKELESWVEPKYRRRHSIPSVSENCTSQQELSFGNIEITGVSDASKFLLFDENQPLTLSFGALGGHGILNWYVDGIHTALIPASKPFVHRFVEQGNHQVMIIDPAGSTDRIEFNIGVK